MLEQRKWAFGWVAAGQALTAVGTVVGLRILTQNLEPAVFGQVTLLLAAAALALGVTCTPLTQAAMYFFPGLAPEGREALLTSAVWRGIRSSWIWVGVAVLIAGGVYIVVGNGTISIVLATVAVLLSDCWRSINTSLLNANAQHRRYGAWLALEAWARPLCATAAVLILGASATAVLWSYAAASLLINLALSPRGWKDESGETVELDRRLWSYAWPLVPLGLLGWANGVSDRYIIGGLLSLQDTGVYAAAYGLASRPMLLLNQGFEQFMRPMYQHAVSTGQPQRAAMLLRRWMLSLAVSCAAVVILFYLMRDELGSLFLGARFRGGAVLMPWIASGYSILALSYVFERINYAHGRTRRVLLTEATSGVAALVLTTVGVRAWGLMGAAVAVPCYFSVQLVFAILLSRRTQNLYQYRPT
jgi:O-antigen/teichoic acid export membrane protein